MRKTVLVFAAVVFMVNAAAAVNVTGHPEGVVGPGMNQTIGNYTISADNETVTVSEIFLSGLPFTTSFSPSTFSLTGTNNTTAYQNVSATVSVSEGFNAGNYTGTVTFSFDDHPSVSQPISVQVPSEPAWNVTDTNFTDTVSVGTEGEFGSFVLENTGNVDFDNGNPLTVNFTGNISQYIDAPQRVLAFSGNPVEKHLTFDLDADTPFGYYNGFLFIEGGGSNASIPVGAEFLDEIPPVVDSVQINDFMATQPTDFRVGVSDNLDVQKVSMTVLYTETVNNTVTEQQGNKTVTKFVVKDVNRTYQETDFTKVEGKPVWSVTPKADRIGDYWLNGLVVDAAGNPVEFHERFSIEALNVVEVPKDLPLRNFKIGTDTESRLGLIRNMTEVTVRLTSFDQPVKGGNESWTVGVIDTEGSRATFDDVGDTIHFRGEGDFLLYLRSDTAEPYNGELCYSGVKQHVELDCTSFYGEMKNWTQPENLTYQLGNLTYRFEPVYGSTQSDTGWNMSAFVSVKQAPNGVEDQQVLLTTKKAEQKEERENAAKVAAAQEEADDAKMFAFGGVSIGVLTLLYYLYRTRLKEYHVHWPFNPFKYAQAPGDD